MRSFIQDSQTKEKSEEYKPDTSVVAPSDHVGELLGVSRAGDQTVGHGLVTLPPWAVVGTDDQVLVGGRYLDEKGRGI